MAPRLLCIGVERPAKPATRAGTTKETAMVSFIAFAEITGTILAAFALAVGLEWLGLNGLIRLMPARRNPPDGQGQ
jgi:hypothetical protein